MPNAENSLWRYVSWKKPRSSPKRSGTINMGPASEMGSARTTAAKIGDHVHLCRATAATFLGRGAHVHQRGSRLGRSSRSNRHARDIALACEQGVPPAASAVPHAQGAGAAPVSLQHI